MISPGLSKLDAAGLAERLKGHFDGVGGLTTATEVEIARELVRRARGGERVRLAMRRLLTAVEWLDVDGLPLAAGQARELQAAVEQARGELRTLGGQPPRRPAW